MYFEDGDDISSVIKGVASIPKVIIGLPGLDTMTYVAFRRVIFFYLLFFKFNLELRSSVEIFIVIKVCSKTFSSLLRTDQSFIHTPAANSHSPTSKSSVIHCCLYTHARLILHYSLLLRTTEIMHQVD